MAVTLASFLVISVIGIAGVVLWPRYRVAGTIAQDVSEKPSVDGLASDAEAPEADAAAAALAGEEVAMVEEGASTAAKSAGSEKQSQKTVKPAPQIPYTNPWVQQAEPSSPSQAVAAPTFPVTFSSVPLGAQVFVDGVFMGQTPLQNQSLTAGDHKVKLEVGETTASRSIHVGQHAPRGYVWRQEGDKWESRY